MTQAVDVRELVETAVRGEQRAWDMIVDRYMPLVVAVARRYRLGDSDAEDVSQTVWLRLVEHLAQIREPRALPQWIVMTTKNEALRVLNARRRVQPADPSAGGPLDVEADVAELDAWLLQAERDRELNRALLDGLAALSAQHRRLVLLCVADPPLSYDQIGRELGMPVGSIGPTRARCMAKLRASGPIKAFHNSETSEDGKGWAV